MATTSHPSATNEQLDLRIEVVDSPSYFYGKKNDGENCIQSVIANAFGRQIRDAIWRGLNPGWDTPEGSRASAERVLKRWQGSKALIDKDGRLNVVFLVATVRDLDQVGGDLNRLADISKRKVVGTATWAQTSQVPGYGEPVFPDMRNDDGKGHNGIAELYPNDTREQDYWAQAWASLLKRRAALAQEKATAFQDGTLPAGEKPALFHLDLCVVDPAWQRRGIAQKLVGWGIEEARRRGGLECTTEASSMGRGAYMKLGFKPEGDGQDIVYEIDDEFKNEKRDPLPPNLFLRTGLLR